MRRLFSYAGLFLYAPAFFMHRPFLCAGLFTRRPFLCDGIFYTTVFFMRRPFFMRQPFMSRSFLYLKAGFFICWVFAMELLTFWFYRPFCTNPVSKHLVVYCLFVAKLGIMDARQQFCVVSVCCLSGFVHICRVKRLWCLNLVRYWNTYRNTCVYVLVPRLPLFSLSFFICSLASFYPKSGVSCIRLKFKSAPASRLFRTYCRC